MISQPMTKNNRACSPNKNGSPRGYLSWSQLSLWEKDPNMYYQVYVEGLDQFRTKYLELGKRMATALENGFDDEHDPLFEMLVVFMPGYPEREFEMNAVFEGIPLKGKLDGWNEKTLTIGEYKTGKKWTQSMVDNCGQLTFYALLVWLKYGKLPNKIYLHWARTDEDMVGNLKLTGEIKTFEAKRTLRDIIMFAPRLKLAWASICELDKFVKINNGY